MHKQCIGVSSSLLYETFFPQHRIIRFKRAYLCVGHIHPCRVESVFDLLPIVDLQQVIAPKLHLCQLLVVFKEVHWEGHLTGGPGG